MKLFFIFLIALFPLFSFASFKKGNGGTAIHCPLTRSWLVLDYFEATAVHGLNPAESIVGSEFGMGLLANRLTRISQNWSNEFKVHLLEFDQNTLWLQDMVVSPVDDSEPVVLPAGCYSVQAIVQRNQFYLIDLKVWNSLSVSQQNILRSHEILYRLLLKIGKIEESSPVRALNSLLISDELDSWTDQQLRSYLTANDLLRFLR
jgi:hypothetical protein